VTKDSQSILVIQVHGSSAVVELGTLIRLREASNRSLQSNAAEDTFKDSKKKGFFLVINGLSLVRTPDNKTHNDAEDPPDYKIGAEKKDKKSCTNDRTGDNKTTKDN